MSLCSQSAAATSSWVESRFEAHSATSAPPAFSASIRFAVSVVTCRHAPIRTPWSGRSFSNRCRISASTPISPAAHSMRSRPFGASPRSFTNRNAPTMNAPNKNPSVPKIVTIGVAPNRYFAPGEASYSFFARYGSKAAASAESVITAPFAKVTPRAHFVLQSPILLNAKMTGTAARKYARCAFAGVFHFGWTRANQSGRRPSSPCATMIRVHPM